MPKSILIIILSTCSILAFSQENEVEFYYDSQNLVNQVSLKKGKFKLTEKTLSDSISVRELSNTKSNKKIWTKYFLRGKAYGTWRFYNQKDTSAFTVEYGKIIPANTLIVDLYAAKPVQFVDENFVMPKLGGNSKGLAEYFRKKFQYPREAQRMGIQGKVIV